MADLSHDVPAAGRRSGEGRLRAILNQWDPVGVRPGRPDGAPSDEYDDLIPGLLVLLDESAADVVVRRHLETRLAVDYGLPSPVPADVVARILAP